jgi:hypothetical protein
MPRRFPRQLEVLFSQRTLKGVKDFVRSNTLSIYELADAVDLSWQIGFEHGSKRVTHTPKYLQDGLRKASDHIENGNVGKGVGMVTAVFEQEFSVVTHFFRKESEWHIIYFSDRDLIPGDQNRWKEGSHVHFVNHLWRNFSLIDIWEALSARKYGSIGEHYRFLDRKRRG